MNYARMVGSKSPADAAKLEEQLKQARAKKAQQQQPQPQDAAAVQSKEGKETSEGKGVNGVEGEFEARDARREAMRVERKERAEERERQRFAAYQARRQQPHGGAGGEAEERQSGGGGDRRERSWRKVERDGGDAGQQLAALKLDDVKGREDEKGEAQAKSSAHPDRPSSSASSASEPQQPASSPLPTAVRAFSYAEMARRTAPGAAAAQKVPTATDAALTGATHAPQLNGGNRHSL